MELGLVYTVPAFASLRMMVDDGGEGTNPIDVVAAGTNVDVGREIL
jgi:hypothetical protein